MRLNTFVSDAQTPVTRGRQIGEAWGTQIRRTSSLYLELFTRLGLPPSRIQALAGLSFVALQDWSPALSAELEATAAASDMPLWHLAAINARTEILAMGRSPARGECSTVVYAPPGPRAPQTLQTWDWHGALAPEAVVMQLVFPSGRMVKLFTEFGVLGKIGVNNSGLGVHFNILHHASDNGSGGVPVHAIARRILDEADTVEEAIAIASSARASASSVITVMSKADRNPRAVSIEISRAGTAVVDKQRNHWLIHTNHFLDPELGRGEATTDAADTHARFDHLNNATRGMVNLDVRERALAMRGPASSVSPIWFLPDASKAPFDQWQTLLTVGIDTANCALDLAVDTPDRMAGFEFLRF